MRAFSPPLTRLRLKLIRSFPFAFGMRDGCVTVPLQFGTESRRFLARAGSSDLGVMRQIFAMRDYRLDDFGQSGGVQALYRSIVEGGQVPLIIDAGANIGASAVWFAMSFPEAAICAVEPAKENAALLVRNTEGLRVDVVEGAIGADEAIGSLVDPGEGEWAFRLGEPGGVSVSVRAAKGLVAEQCAAGRAPFIFKVDIEGGEAELFAKDVDWMDAFAVVIVELHDWQQPGLARSRAFLRSIAERDFDFVYRGENVFCFNNSLLRRLYASS